MKNIDITEEELIIAKIYIEDEIAKHPGCMELETIKNILDGIEKKLS